MMLIVPTASPALQFMKLHDRNHQLTYLYLQNESKFSRNRQCLFHLCFTTRIRLTTTRPPTFYRTYFTISCLTFIALSAIVPTDHDRVTLYRPEALP
jgi:hypothetical protein